MTVIGRKRQSCEYPNSNTGSDVDPLDIQGVSASDTESIVSEVVVTSRNSRRSRLTDECSCRKGYVGRRKRRLFQNNAGTMLQTLSENEEINSSYVQLMDDYQTPFERLMENETALKFWNEFNELSEEEQYLLINPYKEQKVLAISLQENSVTRISSRVKRAMRIKKIVPYETIADIEKSLLDHFEKSPSGAYKTSPKNSFDRLMLNAIAYYHNLETLGINGSWPPCFQVFTNSTKWKPTELLFCDTIKQFRK